MFSEFKQTRVLFRREAYRGGNSAGDVPRWHVAVRPYRKGELYSRYLALCGYEIEIPYLSGGELSYAKKPRGPVCKKCRAADEGGS